MAFVARRTANRNKAERWWGKRVPLFRPILNRRKFDFALRDVVPELSDGLRVGDLEVRLARTAAEIRAAQALRYRVFYDEGTAQASAKTILNQRDADSFDRVSDHLLVIDHNLDGAVVGTYRLIRRVAATRHGGFYSEDEFDIAKLLNTDGEILELGRSCVDAKHRNRPTMQLLWRGIAQYVRHYDISLMFGCASFHGTNPRAHALPLSYLYHHHLAPLEIRPRARPERYAEMNLLPPDRIDRRSAIAALPPLIKGYLRLGGVIGDGAVIDYQFNTVDVCIVVETDRVTGKYLRHYTRDERPKNGET